MKTSKVKAEMRCVKWWHWRLKLSVWITNLACWIGRDKSAESWVYYCPHCGMRFSDRKPDNPGVLVLTCPYCNYQSLVGGSPKWGWYAINPDILQDGVELCRHGCHYQEPYGFVSMAGCPVHD